MCQCRGKATTSVLGWLQSWGRRGCCALCTASYTPTEIHCIHIYTEQKQFKAYYVCDHIYVYRLTKSGDQGYSSLHAHIHIYTYTCTNSSTNRQLFTHTIYTYAHVDTHYINRTDENANTLHTHHYHHHCQPMSTPVCLISFSCTVQHEAYITLHLQTVCSSCFSQLSLPFTADLTPDVPLKTVKLDIFNSSHRETIEKLICKILCVTFLIIYQYEKCGPFLIQ